MTEILCFNIETLDENAVQYFFAQLPADLKKKILNYHLRNDQLLKLMGKILVQYHHLKNQRPFNWNDWQATDLGKPFLKHGTCFNISHSHHLVIAAFADSDIGIDIEFKKDINWSDLAPNFHQLEQDFIQQSNNKIDAFYHVWTQKEAFLKAIGTGISKGLNNESCLESPFYDDRRWHIQPIGLKPEYAIAVCAQELNDVVFTDVHLSDLKLSV